MIRDHRHPGKTQGYAFNILTSIKNRVGWATLFCPPFTCKTAGKKTCPPYLTHARSLKSINKYQSGAVLAISLIILLLLTIIGVTGMQTSGLEEKMAGNARDRNLAFQAAEASMSAAKARLSPTLPTFVTTTTNGATAAASPTASGYYSSAAVAPAVETDAFWTFAGNYQTYSGGTLVGIDTTLQPRYTIQDLGCAVSTSCPGAHNYRITARATGGTTNAVVILQSIVQL